MAILLKVHKDFAPTVMLKTTNWPMSFTLRGSNFVLCVVHNVLVDVCDQEILVIKNILNAFPPP